MQGQISAGGLIVGGMIGQRGAPGNGIVSITYKSSSGLEDTYEVLYTNGETDDIVVTNGAEGNGIVSITKTSSVGLVDTYTILYTNGSSDTIEVHNGEKGDKGDTGATGATPNLTIGNVTKGADASATITGTTDNPVLNLVLPKGDKGDKGDTGNTGATGNGIYSVTKTGTADLVDTYTILYTNGETTTFTITNGAKGDTGATGNGISTITKTGTAGLVDTYTITYTNGNTTTFEVTNGANGSVTDVQVEGTSVVDNGVANIVGLATQEELDRYKTIYNVLPKVTGNGESITLDNTGESILKLDLKGQCKQDSTTGKNLLNIANGTNTNADVTWTITDSTISGTGTANGTWTSLTNFKAFPTPLEAGTYTFSIPQALPKTFQIVLKDSDNTNHDINVNAGETYKSVTTTYTAVSWKLAYRAESESVSISIPNKLQLESGSSATSWERYTGGQPSPSPDFPQQIHEVSGDNEINVCGKNILDTSNVKGAGWNIYGIPNTLKPNTKYTFSIQGTTSFNYGLFTTSGVDSQTTITRLANYQSAGNSVTFTTPADMSNEKGLLLGGNGTGAGNESIDVIKPQIELGETKTDYEPYNGDTYELDLGVENKFDESIMLGLTDWVKNSEGYYTGNSSYLRSYMNTNRDIIDFKANTQYTISFYAYYSSGTNDRMRIEYTDGTNSETTYFTNSPQFITLTSLAGKTIDYIVMNYTTSGTMYIKDFQVEEGTKANSYSPYGTTPIKMRGIGTYEDYFVRNSGKNLFDKDNANIINGYFTPTTPTITSNANHRIIYIPIQPNTAYTIQKSNAGGDKARFGIGTTTITPTADVAVSQVALENSATSQTITTNSTANYLVVWCYFTDNTSITESELLATIQIEKGSTATTYEPYGTGLWCKYNAVYNHIFDGTETLTTYGSQTNRSVFAYDTGSNLETYSEANTVPNILCTHLIPATQASTWKPGDIARRKEEPKTIYYVLESGLNVTTGLQWLVDHNVKTTTPLNIPYLSPIESETLQSQLDAIEKALGKDGQINISQVNNDAPFKIYASALMKISGE